MRKKTIVSREMMNTITEGCPACGRKFNMGDPVVIACGAWEGPPKFIHENEAVYDEKTDQYFERKCYEAERQLGGREQL